MCAPRPRWLAHAPAQAVASLCRVQPAGCPVFQPAVVSSFRGIEVDVPVAAAARPRATDPRDGLGPPSGRGRGLGIMRVLLSRHPLSSLPGVLASVFTSVNFCFQCTWSRDKTHRENSVNPLRISGVLERTLDTCCYGES